MRLLLRLSVVGLLLVVLGRTAPADVLYSNFGAGDSYNTTTGWTIGNGGYSVAMFFDVPGSVNDTFDGLDLAAFHLGGTDAITTNLRSDASGLPGALLEGFSLTPASFASSILSATSTLHPTLTAGDRYWLELLPGDTTTWAAWDWSGSDTRTIAASTDGGASYFLQDPTTYGSIPNGTDGVFRIYGTPVPEPAFYQLGALLALGGLGVLRLRRRA